MKLKFTILTFLLLFARGCDFYSTSLWFFQENGMRDEMNPLADSSVQGGMEILFNLDAQNQQT